MQRFSVSCETVSRTYGHTPATGGFPASGTHAALRHGAAAKSGPECRKSAGGRCGHAFGNNVLGDGSQRFGAFALPSNLRYTTRP